MRAYRKIGDLKKFRDIREGFADVDLVGTATWAPRHIFGASEPNAEVVVRQLLIQRLAGGKLTEKILYQLEAGMPQTYSMPSDFRGVLHKNEVETNKFSSDVAWSFLVVKYWVHGFATGLRLFFLGIKNSFHPMNKIKLPFAHFMGLGASNLPVPGGTGTDILTWYRDWDGRDPHLEMIAHDVLSTPFYNPTTFYLPPPFMLMEGWLQLWHFLSWHLKTSYLSALLALRGKWWAAFVFSEAAKAKSVSLIPQDKLATEYFFYYSASIYRPMWTYEAASLGSKITSYFYSNSEQIRTPGEESSQRFEWGAANWPKYLVWDEYQATVIKRDIKSANVEVVGPIGFISTNQALPEIPTTSVAVFDVQPHRPSLHFGISTTAEYLRRFPDVEYRFLEDIEVALSQISAQMAIKQKRQIDRWGVKKYNSLLRKLSAKEGVTMVPAGVAAPMLIDACQVVLSFPFTSTALYAKQMGKPSAYYDPMSWINRDDPGAHGLTVIHGRSELSSWVLLNLDYC